MKILLTSDLHRDGKKLLWLLDEAPEHDALFVAGDLLDIFSNTGFNEQKGGDLRWRETILQSGKSFAWCSGNHDFFHGDHTPMAAASPLWMREKPSTKTCITDGESRFLETPSGNIAVTTIPWPVHGGDHVVDGYRTTYFDFVKRLLQAGRKIKNEERVPWIVLNHEPPGGTPLSAAYAAPEADFARRIIEAAEPDFSLHGHIHQAPTAPGGSGNSARPFVSTPVNQPPVNRFTTSSSNGAARATGPPFGTARADRYAPKAIGLYPHEP